MFDLKNFGFGNKSIHFLFNVALWSYGYTLTKIVFFCVEHSDITYFLCALFLYCLYCLGFQSSFCNASAVPAGGNYIEIDHVTIQRKKSLSLDQAARFFHS